MRTFIWLCGLVLFVGFTVMAFLIHPPPGSPARGGVDREPAAAPRDALRRVQAEFRRKVTDAERRLDEELHSVKQAVSALELGSLRSLLQALEIRKAASGELLAAVIEELRSRSHERGLEFLVVLMRDGRVLSSVTGLHEESDLGEARSTFARTMLEAGSKSGGASALIEALPLAWVAPLAERAIDERLDPEAVVHGLFLAGTVPVWIRPDAPGAALLGGMRLETVLDRSVAASGGDDPVPSDWHVFSFTRGDVPVVISGARAGSLVRRSLVRDLFSRTASEMPAFTEVGLQVGCWRAVRSPGGGLLGGWGASADPDALARLLRPPPVALTPVELPAPLELPGVLEMVVVTGVVLFGLGVLWLLLALWARYVRPAAVHDRSTRGTGAGWESSRSTGDEPIVASAHAAKDREDFLRLYEELDALRAENELAEERRVALERSLEHLQERAGALTGFQKALSGDSLPVPMVAVDSRLEVVIWNSAAGAFWGLPAPAAIGRPLEELALGPPPAGSRLRDLLRRTIETRRGHEALVDVGETGDTQEHPIRLRAEPIIGARGHVAGAVFTVGEVDRVPA